MSDLSVTTGLPASQGLYDPSFEHDACGIGFVAQIQGKKSHDIILKGIQVLVNLTHRGACGCDPETGDGAGVLIQIPHQFFARECARLGFTLPSAGDYGVGVTFLPVEPLHRRECEGVIERLVRDEGLGVLGWRDTPIDASTIGRVARGSQPYIQQIFISRGTRTADRNGSDLERRLYLVRKRIESALPDCYIPSLSARTIIYKGLLLAPQIARFYPELSDPEVVSALCLVHQRFSTNTFPTWQLAHPYRYIAHNGEINTLRGNVNWMHARQAILQSPLFGEDIRKLFPIIQPGGSDSAAFDNALELLVMAGRSLPHAMAMLIPEAWSRNAHMDPQKRAFYEYHASLMEPWDGPAAIAFTDGRSIGALLDRNGLRPARYVVTHDDLMVMASETGVLPVRPEEVKKKGRLQPGKMLLVDTLEGRIVSDREIKRSLYSRNPYQLWIKENQITLDQLPDPPREHPPDQSTLVRRQRAFGYTAEDIKMILAPMDQAGAEPVGSMGTDIPLACLSDQPQPLFHYFKQLFAQVTNPPIDPIREEMVMSLISYIGTERNILDETPQHCHTLKLPHPILTNRDLEKLRRVSQGDFLATTLPMFFAVEEGARGLERALTQLCRRASLAIQSGYTLLILSDRGLDLDHAAIPSLLALAAVHNHLVREETRTQVALIVESGEPREVMHFALLIGYGASAINPYLALETVTSQPHFVKSINKGLLKTFSKMGISTLQSYRGAQVFEAIGLNREVIDRYFTGTPSRIEGIGLEVIAREAILKHQYAFEPVTELVPDLPVGGNYQYRVHGEYHLYNPDTIAKLQHAVAPAILLPASGAASGNERSATSFSPSSVQNFDQYTSLIDQQSSQLCTLRGLLEVKRSAAPIPLDDVEPAAEIVRRFATGAMSFGSISQEAHETLAIAMNRIGGRSNTGEGGEDEARFHTERRSAIKQVASARFGVTANYLVNADELQIKMAQGAKPGEGGQLPGHKVDAYIARVRHSTPGVGLISPPPHHDIYSIEDLAQLIYDLKNVNPHARISVKLVAEVGVGTVAAGVAKAHADVILISGDSGGTGASPLSSIQHAGIPWELGLAETQQVLVMNDLRGRVRLQTDGKLLTGRDVVVAALLGAEEFGFATAPLVALGCIMMRKCHLNTCPVGIATQDPVLRAKFRGTPEHVINFFFLLAQQVRGYMASLGFRTFDEMVGRVGMLEPRAAIGHWKAKGVDLSMILHNPQAPSRVARRCVDRQNHGLEQALDYKLIDHAREALENGAPIEIKLPIRNVHRTVGAMLSGEVARRYGSAGLPEDTIRCHFTGSAGQSFGAFLGPGVTLELEGDANDYVGKGLSGGRVIVYPPRCSTFLPEENILIGNVALYGATSGEAFFNGVAGERFAVRNSGATAVVEGLGDHGCEYMTRGTVVVLGRSGRNFAAGMSGGTAYVFDSEGNFAEKRCNHSLVGLCPVAGEDERVLYSLIEKHASATASPRARWILENWLQMLPKFLKVRPKDSAKAGPALSLPGQASVVQEPRHV